MTEVSYSLETIIEDDWDMKTFHPIYTLMIRRDILLHAGLERVADRMDRCIRVATRVHDCFKD